MITRINCCELICAMIGAALLAGCASSTPPPLPPNNAADPQVRGSSRAPGNLLALDETTVAIQRQLSTKGEAERAESMPGMQHGEMPHSDVQLEKKTLAEEMKKTSDEMKATSDELKRKSDEPKVGAVVYTCPMHPQIRSDKPGNCPICGMTLVKKENPHGDH